MIRATEYNVLTRGDTAAITKRSIRIYFDLVDVEISKTLNYSTEIVDIGSLLLVIAGVHLNSRTPSWYSR